MIHLYGIPNCDTVKKSIDFLKQQQAVFSFHNFKTEPVAKTKLKAWTKAVGLQALVNKKSTTWRGLTPVEQEKALDEKGALALMHEKSSVIKRPVAEWPDGSVTVGFDEKMFTEKLSSLL